MKRMAVLGMLALVSWSAQADDGDQGWRAGAAVSFGQFTGKDVHAPELGNKFIEDNAVGYKVYGQYQFNDWFGLEGAYHYTSNFEDKSPSEHSSLTGKLQLSFSGFSAQGLLYVPTTIEDFKAYVKAGMYVFNDQLAVNGTTNSNSSERGLVGGAGVIFHITDNLGIRAEYERFKADVGDLSAVNLGVEYSFGGRKAAPMPTKAPAAAPPPPPPPPSVDN